MTQKRYNKLREYRLFLQRGCSHDFGFDWIDRRYKIAKINYLIKKYYDKEDVDKGKFIFKCACKDASSFVIIFNRWKERGGYIDKGLKEYYETL